MFANKEEAARAARVASRITGRRAEVWPEADRGIAVGFADESRAHMGYVSWDELADFLAAGYRSPREDQADTRAGLLAQARANLHIGQSHLDLSTRLSAVLATLECVLEVLA